jgi:vacuolar-type H+-ATPase subunit I/STV1
MEINLRKANAIQSEIRRAIQNAEAKDTVSVTEYTTDIAGVVDKAVTDYQTDVTRKIALTTALFNIRKSVGQVNATAGINDILADVQSLDAVMAIYSGVANKQVAKSVEEITARVEKLKTAPADARSSIYGERYNNVETSTVTQSAIDTAKAKVKELKRQRQAMQDKLLTLNVNTLITITGVDENVLKLEGIL